MNLDTEFQIQLDNNADLQKDPDVIIKLRQRYAKDLLKDKRFIFGKFSISESGMVCTLFIFEEHSAQIILRQVKKSRPYQSALILRTFASSFKHLKDVKLNSDRDEKDGPLPSSRYPKTLLAVTAAAVS